VSLLETTAASAASDVARQAVELPLNGRE